MARGLLPQPALAVTASDVHPIAMETTMTWTTPTFELLKMDAEIGSYNEDTDPEHQPPVAEELESNWGPDATP